LKSTEDQIFFFEKNSRAKVLCFGELLLRICPDTEGEWLQQNSLPFYVGGAEANVAAALALWKADISYCSVVPDNLMTQQLITFLQQKNIDTSPIVFTGEKLGLYFLPKGKDVKHAGVIYDRSGSSFSQVQTNTIDWDKALQNISWLHFTAISPALSQNVADVCLEAVQAAKSKNILVSVDLNYRPKLWQYGKQPADVMPQLVEHCDVVMGNIWAAEKMLGIPVANTSVERLSKEELVACAQHTTNKLIENYSNIKVVANTFRFDYLEKGIEYFATVSTKHRTVISNDYFTEAIVDKVGSGDCFMAGLIFGLTNNWSLQEIADFATTAAFLKLFVEGDATNETYEEIIKFKEAYEKK